MKKVIIFICLFVLLFLGAFAIITQTNWFTSGFVANDFPTLLNTESKKITAEGISYTFTATQKHFAGFNVFVQKIDGEGDIALNVSLYGENISKTTVAPLNAKEDFPKLRSIYLNAKLKVGKTYTLTLATNQGQSIDIATHNDEPFIAPAYAQLVFSKLQLLFVLIVVAATLCFMLSGLLHCSRPLKILSALAVLFVLCTNNFYYNFLNADKWFTYYSEASNFLILDHAEEITPHFFGLGYYDDMQIYIPSKIEDIERFKAFEDGYNASTHSLLLALTPYVKHHIKDATHLLTPDGTLAPIKNRVLEEAYAILQMNDAFELPPHAGRILSLHLANATQAFQKTDYIVYSRHFGLQGHAYKFLFKFLDYKQLQAINAMLVSFALLLVCVLLNKKYNFLFAATFFCAFFFPPLCVRLSKELYWVVFTWLLPLCAGLFSSLYVHRKGLCRLSYAFIYLSVLIKCLCGYEFITAIMVFAVSFLLADVMTSIAKKDYVSARKQAVAVVISGLLCLLAFATALTLQATALGNGSLLQGLKSIWENDVLRRTHGANINLFYLEPFTQLSMQASIWEVILRLYQANAPYLLGVNAQGFMILQLFALAVLVYDIIHKKANVVECALFIIFYFAGISWAIFGKSHTYIHLNYAVVMWFLGHAGLCLFIIFSRFLPQYRLRS